MAALVWHGGSRPWWLAALVVGLVAFVLGGRPRPRAVALTAILLLQAVNLFLGVKNEFLRPSIAFETMHEYDPEFQQLAKLLPPIGRPRAYLTSVYYWGPGLMQKTGMLHDFDVIGDYEPFASQRIKSYFEAVTPPVEEPRHLFHGRTTLRPDSDWRLLDLTSTRFYLVSPASPLGLHLNALRSDPATGWVMRNREIPRIFERRTAFPRAYLVPRARRVRPPETALSILQSEEFDGHQEVVLEDAPREVADHGDGEAPIGEVHFEIDEPERVVLLVEATRPGFLVLTDSYHPDWRARTAAGPVPIYRANHLFRAIPVPAGESRVEMTFRPRALRVGTWIASATLIVLVGLGWHVHRRVPRARPVRSEG
jgi:hypothetical protein